MGCHIEASSWATSNVEANMTTGMTDDFTNGTDTAGRLVADGSAVSGCLENTLDSDWFALDVTAGDIMRIDVSGLDNGFWHLILRDENGDIIPTPDQFMTDGSSDFLAFMADYTGTVFVEVVSASFPQMAPATGDYTITTSLITDDAGNDLSGALSIANNQVFNGSISYFEDQDWMAIDIVAGQSYNLSLSGLDGDGDIYQVTIYGEDGTVFDQFNGSQMTQNYVAEYTGQAFIAVELIEHITPPQMFFSAPAPTSSREDNVGDYNLLISTLSASPNSIDGSDMWETLNGSFNGETILAGAGWDIINGSFGDDIIDGGDGRDSLVYDSSIFTSGVTVFADGRNLAEANGGDYVLNMERITTTELGDVVYLGEGFNLDGARSFSSQVSTLGGDDIVTSSNGYAVRVFAGDGNDSVTGANLRDILDGGNGDDYLVGRGGNDTLRGEAGNDRLLGGSGDDLLSGLFGDDWLNGQSGNDRLLGDDGQDQLRGGSGDDTLFGGADNDSLYGGAHNDILSGDNGDDLLFGGGGNDDLMGGFGQDILRGGEGDDILFGGQDNDVLIGGAGADTFVFTNSGFLDFQVDRIVDFNAAEGDVIDISDFAVGDFATLSTMMTQAGNNVRIDFGDNEILVLVNTDLNILSAANFGLETGRVFIEGTDGDDVLIGSNVDNVFFGGLGDDVIDGNGGSYNQADYEGALADYAIFRNDDGSVTVTNANSGTDTLYDIDGFWFGGEAQWYSMDDAINITPDGDMFLM